MPGLELLQILPTSSALCAIASASGAAFSAACALTAAAAAASTEAVACQTLTPLHAVLRLERSSKWPDDAAAITALKTAFYLKLQYALNKGGGRGGGLLLATARAHCLDIAAGGFVFRFTIAVEREARVLAGIAGRGPLERSRRGAAAAAAAGAAGMGEEEDEEEGSEGEAGEMGEDEDEEEEESEEEDFSALWSSSQRGHRAEPAPNKTARRAVERATGIAVGKQRMSLAEMAAASRAVFRGGTVQGMLGASGAARAAAGRALDALFLAGTARPEHASYIHAIALTHPTFGPAVRLVGLWLRAQGLGGEEEEFLDPPASSSSSSEAEAPAAAAAAAAAVTSQPPMPHEAVELLMAAVYLLPLPHAAPPATATLGFLRWLTLVGSKDWANEPLLLPRPHQAGAAAAALPGEGGGAATAYRTLQAQFSRVRAQTQLGGGSVSGPALYVVVEPKEGELAVGEGEEEEEEEEQQQESAGRELRTAATLAAKTQHPWWKPVWTRSSPTPSVLSTLAALARATAGALERGILPSFAVAASASASASSSGRGPVHAALTGPAGGSTFASAAGAPPAPLPGLLVYHALHSSGGAAAPQPQGLLPAAALYHGSLELSAPARIPRHALDGRYMGVLQPPALVALALASLPSRQWQLAGSQAAGEAEAEAEAGVEAVAAQPGSAGGGGAAATAVVARPKLVLAVASEDGAAASAEAAAAAAAAPASGSSSSSAALVTFHPRTPLPHSAPFLQPPLGLSGGSHFSLPLYANLLAKSRSALLTGFHPLATYLHCLRAHPPLASRLLFFPSIRLCPVSGAVSAQVGCVLRRAAAAAGEGEGGAAAAAAESNGALAMAPLLAKAAELGCGLVERARLGQF